MCRLPYVNILVTAGPTREFIDPVRFLSNRSTGKMGYAVAAAARRAGHTVRLISGPVTLPPPDGVSMIHVISAEDMLNAVTANLPWSESLVMAAAVADWRPAHTSRVKLKKTDLTTSWSMERTPDILASLRGHHGHRIIIGFAAETGQVHNEAARKLREKELDAIIANDVSQGDAGFEVDTNRVTVMTANGPVEEWPLMSKDAVGDRIVQLIERLSARPA